VGTTICLKFTIPYQVFPDRFGSHIYSVIVKVQLALPAPNAPRTKRFEAIVDSGATRCCFSADVADFLGIDLKSGPPEKTIGISGTEETYLHDVKLYLPGGAVQVKAGFKEKLPVAGLLGMNGFFEHFKVLFDSDSKVCELEQVHRA
jgi:hypothetical protein